MQQSTQQPQSARFFCRRGALLAAVLSILSCTTPEEKDTLIGTFTMFNRESPYLIAAPHGEFDENTGELVYDFCEKVRWDCLIAEGFREDGARINVNRPTEGLRLSEAQFTERASLVYAKYLNRIRRLSPQVHFYVEIHGHENKDLAETVEVATVGLSVDQAQHIKDLFSESFKREGLPPLVIKVDPRRRVSV